MMFLPRSEGTTPPASPAYTSSERKFVLAFAQRHFWVPCFAMTRILMGVLSVLLVACGGAPVADTTNETTTEQAVAPVSEPEPEPELGPVEEEVVAAEPEPEPEAPPATDPPLSSPTVEELEAAMLAAASDRHAFARLVDPAWGVGVFDPAEAGVRQYCEMHNIANNPGLGFIFNHGDRFECNRDLTRCTVREGNRSGFAFVFRNGAGDAKYLNTIIHYPRAVPNSENNAARAFLRAGDGVCALHAALRDPDAGAAPTQFSVFVAEETGLVPEALSEHHCADAAANAYNERIGAVRQTSPRECQRNPSMCTYRSGDEDYRVYADEEGRPMAVTITRHGMHDNLARAQQREVDAFLRDARRYSCEEE
jgi:hypothetical protein